MDALYYEPTSTMKRFHASTAPFKCVIGGLACGKTVGCLHELFRQSQAQNPDADGVRRTRHAIVARTSAVLRDISIPGFNDWFAHMALWDPMKSGRAAIKAPLDDGTTLDIEYWFFALDREDRMRQMRNLEFSSVFVDDLDEIKGSESLVSELMTRTQQFPPKRLGGQGVGAVIAACACPAEKHWLSRYAELKGPVGFEFFKASPPVLHDAEKGTYILNPEADNLDNLPGNYYADMLAVFSGPARSKYLCCECAS